MLLAALTTLQAEYDLDDSQVPDLLTKMYQQHSNLIFLSASSNLFHLW